MLVIDVVFVVQKLSNEQESVIENVDFPHINLTFEEWANLQKSNSYSGGFMLWPDFFECSSVIRKIYRNGQSIITQSFAFNGIHSPKSSKLSNSSSHSPHVNVISSGLRLEDAILVNIFECLFDLICLKRRLGVLTDGFP